MVTAGIEIRTHRRQWNGASMAGQTSLTSELLDYVRNVSLREDGILGELRAETAGLPMGGAMLAMPEEAQFLAFLIHLTGAGRVLEIGTFTGYSTLCMARALPPDGRVVTCDITERWVSIATPYWSRAGVEDRIDFRLGDAVETLGKLRREHGPGSFDLVFVDADKANYRRYYEDSLDLVRTGGLVILDNTFLSGRVVYDTTRDIDTAAVRELNAALYADERVDISMLTMADGITLARKR
jgi:O-methyltransferase